MYFLLYLNNADTIDSMHLMTQEKETYSRLMVEAQAGNSEAYHNLLSKISDILSGFLARRIYSFDDREDVLQEILIAIHRSRHTYLPTKPFHPWMYAIAKNILYKYYKKVNQQYSRFVEIEMNQLVSNKEIQPNEKEKADKILLLIQELPKKQRDIISMLKIQGLAVKEVSLKLRMSEANVRVIAHRGYQTIRIKINDEN
ncbi:sigma-70 family RNA polymerase sigma factor [Leptospira vanthielii]|uniref:sigma-70 family RNA polymerase sigma factor n=1 Tax=Leptospira vanthielii TaxID=293085 RepID=UPI00068D3036|nr:sigma-70 family RNA polymerase sigma factor [Leptospira vanthielii]